ncbi:hypothetical protein pb186bvf_020873 [Paramecium bursaria]
MNMPKFAKKFNRGSENQNRRVQTECDDEMEFRDLKTFQDISNLKLKKKAPSKDQITSSIYLSKYDNQKNQQTVKKTRKPQSIEKVTAKSVLAPALTERCDYSSCTYQNLKVIGSGSFGVVYKSKVNETGEFVAIKKVLQDKRYKNRELQILQELDHPNVLRLKHAYFTAAEKQDESYLNVVMEYFPETLYSYNKQFVRQQQRMPEILTKIYSYQLLRSIAYISTLSICHRDIKPHNILVNPLSNKLQLCDFGSAKKLVKGEPNIAYICSRCYRAPELIFGATDYDPQIDVWSVGCVIAELFNGEPLFLGDSAVDQLVEIVKVLGTPTKQQILSMNKNYDMNQFNFVTIKQRDWKKVLKTKDPQAIDLTSKLLTYCPKLRLTPIDALSHPYFDELRDFQQLKNLQNIQKIILPELFDFSPEETSKMTNQLMKKLIPDWYSQASKILKTVG